MKEKSEFEKRTAEKQVSHVQGCPLESTPGISATPLMVAFAPAARHALVVNGVAPNTMLPFPVNSPFKPK